MEELETRIGQEMKRFRAALPRLLAEHPGEWLIFRDGEAQGVFADEDSAYEQAVEKFGVEGGFVIVQAVKETPRAISLARWSFGL